MELTFLQEIFTDYETRYSPDRECVTIRKNGFSQPIEVCCETDWEYTVYFATQHLHIASREKLIAAVAAFARGTEAAIEFYRQGQPYFGGQISVRYLERPAYDFLRRYFGYPHLDISDLTFRTYAWDSRYCLEGFFRKTAPEQVETAVTAYRP